MPAQHQEGPCRAERSSAAASRTSPVRSPTPSRVSAGGHGSILQGWDPRGAAIEAGLCLRISLFVAEEFAIVRLTDVQVRVRDPDQGQPTRLLGTVRTAWPRDIAAVAGKQCLGLRSIDVRPPK